MIVCWQNPLRLNGDASLTLSRLCWLFLACLALEVSGAAEEDESRVLFETLVLPSLEEHCYRCHAETSGDLKGGLLLDRRLGLLQGGDSGPAIVPGDPDQSLLIQAIRHQELRMPPKGDRLSDATIQGFRRWIELGALDPRDAPMITLDSRIDLKAGREHWSFQTIRSEFHDSELEGRKGTSIDAFVEGRLRSEGLSLASSATPRTLMRRLSFDLHGLPPDPIEQARFLSDASPLAYRRLVDRSLSDPKFGERQSQFWLDVVRYAETEGFEYDRHLPDAWRYRDYVINALNGDKAYDRFLTEQLAGDELSSPTTESLSAAVFHRLGAVRRNAGNPDIALSRNEVLTERTDVIGSSILALTIGCARCHDHKFDPISQKDYYQFQAYLAATSEVNVDLAAPEVIDRWVRESASIDQKIKQLKKGLSKVGESEQQTRRAQIDALEESRPPEPPKIPSIKNDYAGATKMHVLKRGDWDRKGEPVGMKPLDVLDRADGGGESANSLNPRSRLAAWLTDRANPLTARVIVNRIWQHYFGVGIVATSNDFGRNGAPPSHPDLLNFLASELIRYDWQLKPIHRLILMSHTYRQSAKVEPTALAMRVDPDNRLMWRHSKRRLTGEELRDAMLSVSGVLNERVGGESVMLPVEQDLVNLLYKREQWRVTSARSEHFRRSVYLIAKRNLRLPFMEAFDQPALLTSCFRRESSTHAPQALELLNGQISNHLAACFAERLDGNASVDLLVRQAYELAFGRLPSDLERQFAVEFLDGGSVKEFALALFNLNEFLYVY